MPLPLIKAFLIFFHILVGWLIAAILFYPACILHMHCAVRLMTLIRQRWYALALHILGVRVHIRGLTRVMPGVLWVGNHVSWLDILVLGSVLPVTFLAKSEVAAWPLVGSMARMSGVIFIRRGSGQGAGARMNAELQRGQSLVLFPEGTTTDGQHVAVFHARLFDGAVKHGFPLRTFCIHYPRALPDRIPFIGDDDFLPHLWRLLKLKKIDVSLIIGQTLTTKLISRKAVAQSAWQIVASQHREQQEKNEYATS